MPLPKLTEPLAIVVKGSVFVLFTGGFLVFKVLSVFFLVVPVPDSGFRLPVFILPSATASNENTDDSEPFTQRI